MADPLYLHSKSYWDYWISGSRPDKSRGVYVDSLTNKVYVDVGGVRHQLIIHDEMPIDQVEPSPPTQEVLATIARHESILAQHGLSGQTPSTG